MHQRERICALEPRDGGILLTTLRTHDEIRSTAEVFDRNLPKPDARMLQIAEKIIEQQEAEFDPTEFKDRYEDALRDLIARKSKGEKLVSARRARGRGQGGRPDGRAAQEPEGRRRAVARQGRPFPGGARPEGQAEGPQEGRRRASARLERGARKARLDRTAIHIAVDMQCLFAEPTEWFVPWLPKVLPNVLEIARRHPERTIFTRFIPPQDPEHANGAWRDYYQRWRSMTRNRIDPHLLELVEPLRKLVPPAKVLNKTVYSAFAHPRLAHSLAPPRRRDADRHRRRDRCLRPGHGDGGGRSRLSRRAADDALCSANDATHDALMKLYRERYSQQIETTSTERVLRDWV